MVSGRRYVPRHFWERIASVYGSVPSNRTKCRMLKEAEVVRDEDGCYGAQELAWMTDLVVNYLNVGKTYKQFRVEKGLETPAYGGFNSAININYEVIL